MFSFYCLLYNHFLFDAFLRLLFVISAIAMTRLVSCLVSESGLKA
ncbi:hypothetical protein HMPREF9420_1905 [Segatella salivae DSM 15606]|uniref:Uncharacterized protein n=1 Tax=Segatella salivae DSM 15606 TaxID=888832 RepID=E6MQY7_9BACT|nr:hypothetical protein HMPREF9420_1905 [Segatella salivae DSM 15606]